MENDWVAFLERQQRVILSKAGNGGTPSFDLYDKGRWTRECAVQTGVSLAVAERFTDRLHSELVAAYDPLTPVQALKAVFAYHLARFGKRTRFDYRAYKEAWQGAKEAGEIPVPVEDAGERGGHLVYKLFDAAQTALYVGITSRGPQRLVEHHRTKSWFGDVDTILFERFTSHEECAAREVALIRELHPVFNVQHNNGCLTVRM